MWIYFALVLLAIGVVRTSWAFLCHQPEVVHRLFHCPFFFSLLRAPGPFLSFQKNTLMGLSCWLSSFYDDITRHDTVTFCFLCCLLFSSVVSVVSFSFSFSFSFFFFFPCLFSFFFFSSFTFILFSPSSMLFLPRDQLFHAHREARRRHDAMGIPRDGVQRIDPGLRAHPVSKLLWGGRDNAEMVGGRTSVK